MYLQNNNPLRLYNILYAQNASFIQRHVAMLERVCNDFAAFFFFFFFGNVIRGVDGEMKSPLADQLYKTVSSIKNFVMSA